MTPLDIPDSGLSLCRDLPGRDPANPTQFMRLDLAQSTLDDLIQSLRDDQPARIRLGKHQTLHYGAKSQAFHSSPESHTAEVYSCSSADKENLYFTGILSHGLEVQKAKEATAATDQALATLEQSLSAFERGKEEKQTHLLTDSEVKALKPGPSARRPTSRVEIEKGRLLKNTPNRSVSSSPGLGVSRSPTLHPSLTPTSVPPAQNKDQLRLDALKVPFIHLVAVRSVSAKFVAQQTRSSVEDCQALARKYGSENRDHRDKFDLKDKAYRELDLWKFPYPSQEDREQAVKNAVSAFDRMRISRSDKLWQMLLPKEERGKGKCLSRLDLRTGPIKKAPTPRIQVQSTEDAGKDGYSTGPETDRASGSGPTPKPAEGATPRSAPTEKKQAGGKDTSAKRTSKDKNTNSTLTGRVTKKTERKPPAKPDGKFKSAEFVNDSDEDSDILEGSAGSQEKNQPEKPQETKQQPKEAKPTAPGIQKTNRVPTPKVDKLEPRKPESSKTAGKGLSSKRPPPPSSNPSPLGKPSPLGSPPTNASDIQSDKQSSTDSSSPATSQIPKSKQPAPVSNAKPAKPNGVKAEAGNSLKRKAETERPPVANVQPAHVNGSLENKRRRDVSTSSGSSDSASPPLGREVLFQQLREKSQKFKKFYSKYRALHDAMASHAEPPTGELERLQRQHAKLQRMKKEIWDEDRQLRERI
ncbi:hypothetical protein PHISP_03499 [Aspergillus sp. HF37]|nr:hypothetical protein PHISP_03499 [Aspergillus sp. HF37]